MTRTLKFFGAFILGVILGAVAMAYLANRAVVTYARILEVSYSIDQLQAAALAARQDQWLTAAIAYHNVAEADSRERQHPLGVEQDAPGLLFPFVALVLEQMAIAADPEEKGHKISASISQAKYALALERSGHAQEAAVEWKRALQYGSFQSVDEAREMATKQLKQDMEFFNEQLK